MMITTVLAHEPLITIQGEFPLVGTLCYLVRFPRCNLACTCTFCDTDLITHRGSYTINSPSGMNVMFTGGEPMLFWDIIEDVLQYSPGIKDIIIETNGTWLENADLVNRVCSYPKRIHFGISPKTPILLQYPYHLVTLASVHNVTLKFVIPAVHLDIPAHVSTFKNVENITFVATPEGKTTEEYMRSLPSVMKVVEMYPFFKVNPRLHIHVNIP